MWKKLFSVQSLSGIEDDVTVAELVKKLHEKSVAVSGMSSFICLLGICSLKIASIIN